MTVTKQVKRVNTVFDMDEIAKGDYVLHVLKNAYSIEPIYSFYLVTKVTPDMLELSSVIATKQVFTAAQASKEDIRVIKRAEAVITEIAESSD